MKPYVRGKNIEFREVSISDAEFIIQLRTDPERGKYLSPTSNEIDRQRGYIADYLKNQHEYYFIITDRKQQPLGTIRIYDMREDSFCWGSWILSKDAPKSAAVESAILIYDFAFFSLHYPRCHFDVRKDNQRVVDFHRRFGARITREDDLNYYFEYDRDAYLDIRGKYHRYLP